MTPPEAATDAVAAAVDAIHASLEQHSYAGIDPYDGLSGVRSAALARVAGRLLGGPARGRQAVVQLHKRAPLDIRPLTGVRPRRIAKALGLIAEGYAALARAGWDGPARERGRGLLAWLEAARVPAGDGRAGWAPSTADALAGGDASEPCAWGYEFDVQTRWAFYPAGTPNVIATTFVGDAFLDWYDLDGDARDLAVARGAAGFIVARLLVGCDGSYFAYVPGKRVLIHNANALAAGFVARAAAAAGDAGAAARARVCLEPTLAAQRPDGLWPYGEGADVGWVDGFHTAYVLSGLYDVWRATGDEALRAPLLRGLGAYIERLFTVDFMPKYTPERTYPLDVHCASTAIDLLVRLRDLDARCAMTARGVTRWTLANMYDGKGGFTYQRTRWYTNRIPYIRWSQAHMFRALARLALALPDTRYLT